MHYSASGTKYAMMDLMLRHVRVVAALSWLLLLPACTGPGLDHADGQPCALAQMGSLPVVQVGNYYAVDGKINNAPVRLLFDTGSFSTVLTWQAARRVGARSDSTIVAPLAGIGGTQQTMVHRAKSFDLGKLHGEHFPFIVAGVDRKLPPSVDGLLGMDVLTQYDIDVDLPGGHINLYAPVHDCSRPSAYLHGDLFEVPLYGATPGHAIAAGSMVSQPRVQVMIRGVAFVALLDSGAPHNMVFGVGARKLGFNDERNKPSKRVREGGVGPQMVDASLRVMEPIVIGDLELTNFPVSVISQSLPDVSDMLLGTDLFRRVHIWISHSSATVIMPYPPAPSPAG
jgi:predicted aspartyl protease